MIHWDYMMAIQIQLLWLANIVAAHFPLAWFLQPTAFWYTFSLMYLEPKLVFNWSIINIVPNLKMNKQCMFGNTATFAINRHLACLWSKISTFQVGKELHRGAAMPILREMFKNTNESFQMRYCMQFFFQGHQNCQNLKIYTFKFT